MAYSVRTPAFDGPIDLLLHLIARQEVDLYDISLADIVEAYLAELDRMGPLDLDLATEFLVIAATLVELKSRRLLPEPAGDEATDDVALLEARDVLVARLVECMTFRGAGEALARLGALAALSWPRTAGLEVRFLEVAPDLLVGIGPDHLVDAYARATLAKVVPRVDLGHVAPLRVSVSEAVEELARRLAYEGPVTFGDLTSDANDRIEVIVRFLALLELYKQGLVDLDQSANFGPLAVRWVGAAAPVDLSELDPWSPDG